MDIPKAIQEAIQTVAGGAFSSATAPAAVGVLSMALLQTAKDISPLNLAFAQAKIEGASPACYELLAMKQVMTVPPLRESRPIAFLDKTSTVVFALPFLVQLMVVLNDLETFWAGWDTNRSSTVILILLFTVACYELVQRTDEAWKREARDLGLVS